ncbi:PEP-CTERM sorting domain-containing protein [Pseudoduganella lutea]|uniref:PEP-CTERM sorting domain-containing protein n=1 Tax=Pseudoduganella lutea TaxID=321985 RepID=A0A4P6KRI6_9BURK|nr:PEP-CTERM sorting domain-containing protein [Pseudoduganella lutea]QBE61669.1 PEP-CTERM sorting domain-containing protein [Pseudoduganella lutea]
MKTSTRFAFAAAAFICSLSAPGAQAAGNFWDLGYGITVSGSSADGSVIGAYVANDSYYMWTAATGVKAIGGAWHGGVASVSADGSRISGSAYGSDGLTYAGYYSVGTGQWTTLGGIGGSSDASASSGWNISGDGKTVVGLGWVNGGTAHAIASTPAGGMSDLGSIGGSSRANGVSYDGSVIAGWVEQPDGQWTGAYWKDGTLHNMVDDQGNALQEAGAVSADGSWIVGKGYFGQSWRYNTLTQQTEWLGDLDAMADFQGATGISADGNIIVGYDRGFGPAVYGKGTIWIEGQGMLDFTDYITSQGIDLGGRTLALPMGVSADGRTFYGMDSTGSGFVITVSAVPEPATYAMMAGGLALLAARRRLRRGSEKNQ